MIYALLVEAKEKINSTDKLIRDKSATDKYGRVVSPKDDNAILFCTLGAVKSVAPNLKVAHQMYSYLSTSAYDIFGRGVCEVNDLLSFRDTMKMWDYAIELAKEDA